MPEFIANFFGTWHAWWYATEPIATHTLWGLPVFIWARIGKILEFVGALFIVVEWIGRQRLAEGAKKADVILSPFGAMPQIGTLRDSLRVGIWMLGSENRVRTANLILIVVGFFLDLMGS